MKSSNEVEPYNVRIKKEAFEEVLRKSFVMSLVKGEYYCYGNSFSIDENSATITSFTEIPMVIAVEDKQTTGNIIGKREKNILPDIFKGDSIQLHSHPHISADDSNSTGINLSSKGFSKNDINLYKKASKGNKSNISILVNVIEHDNHTRDGKKFFEGIKYFSPLQISKRNNEGLNLSSFGIIRKPDKDSEKCNEIIKKYAGGDKDIINQFEEWSDIAKRVEDKYVKEVFRSGNDYDYFVELRASIKAKRGSSFPESISKYFLGDIKHYKPKQFLLDFF